MPVEDIVAGALKVLQEPDPQAKARLTAEIAALWKKGLLLGGESLWPAPSPPDRPARSQQLVREWALVDISQPPYPVLWSSGDGNSAICRTRATRSVPARFLKGRKRPNLRTVELRAAPVYHTAPCEAVWDRRPYNSVQHTKVWA